MSYTDVEIPQAFEFLFTPSRYKIVWGGRGAGKSWAFATALIIKGTQQVEKVLCTREWQSSTKDSVKSLLDRKIVDLGLEYFYRSTRDSIIGLNGTQFLFYGIRRDPAKIKSTDGVTICWNEESQALSQESLDVLIPTIREAGSELWFSMNTGLEEDPVYQNFIKNTVPNSIVKKVNYDENPFFPDVLRDEMEYMKIHNYAKYKHIWLGEPLDLSDSAVFTNWKLGEVGEPDDGVYYFGLDFGYSSDPSALVKCYIDEDKRMLYITDEAYGYHIEIENLPDFIDEVSGSRDQYITADSARPDTISYLRSKDFYIDGSKKGPGSIMEGIEFIHNYSIIVDPKCKNTIYELSHYSFKVDKKTNRILPTVPEDKDNHICDALRYALELYRNTPNYELVIPGG